MPTNVFTIIAPHDFSAAGHGPDHPNPGCKFAFDVGAPPGTRVFFKPWVHVGDASSLAGRVTSIVQNGSPSDTHRHPRIRGNRGLGSNFTDFSVNVDVLHWNGTAWVAAGKLRYQHLGTVSVKVNQLLVGTAETLLGTVGDGSERPWHRVPLSGGPPAGLYWTGPHTHWEGQQANGYTLNWFSRTNGSYGHYFWSI